MALHFPRCQFAGALAATRATYLKQGMPPGPRLGVWRVAWSHRYVPAHPGVSRPLGRFGGQTPEPDSRTQRNLRRASTPSSRAGIAEKATRVGPGVACIGLCCDRIVKMILCRSSRRARPAISKRAFAGHPPSRWHIVFQNSSDLLNRAADSPDPSLREIISRVVSADSSRHRDCSGCAAGPRETAMFGLKLRGQWREISSWLRSG